MNDNFSDGLLGIKVFNCLELVDAIIVEGRMDVVRHVNCQPTLLYGILKLDQYRDAIE